MRSPSWDEMLKVPDLDKICCVHQIFNMMNDHIRQDAKESLETAFWYFVENIDASNEQPVWNRALVERLFSCTLVMVIKLA